ncbi:hypothetical protein ACFTWF_03110 [Rhodococcus sp. NPDC056960]|uniref:hypothetical protein n=1 Tax=Rhodococcus sp. NPDC056960 TaxID=3345982 RepID=UPI00363722CF
MSKLKVEWTREMQEWLDEVVSRMPEPTVRQLDIVKAEFRKVALPGDTDVDPTDSESAT